MFCTMFETRYDKIDVFHLTFQIVIFLCLFDKKKSTYILKSRLESDESKPILICGTRQDIVLSTEWHNF